MSDINELNTQLESLGMDTIKDVDMTPERTAYLEHVATPDWKDKEWVKKLNQLKKAYVLAFHTYLAEVEPHLLYEKNRDKTYWNYNATTGIYDELTDTAARSLVIGLLLDEGLTDSASEYYAKDILARYRAVYRNRGVQYDDFDKHPELFHAHNGWVNVTDLSFTPHDPKQLSRRVSAVDYDQAAICPTYDRFLDEDIKVPLDAVRVIDQFSGLMLTTDMTYQKMLTIIGRPGSGKSTLLDTWNYILGDMAVQKKLTELAGEGARFGGTDLVGKTLCWFDEVEVKRSEMSNQLGTLITGKTFRVERKGINGIVHAENGIKCVLTANNLPNSTEHGMYRRIILIHFKRSFYDENVVESRIFDTLQAESSGILNRMLRGLQDLRKMGGFTVIEGHDELIEDYKASSDSIAEFLDTFFDYDPKAEPIETTQLFRAFKQTIEDRYISGLTPQKFGRMLAAQPLNRFSQIYSSRQKNQRYWNGLRLRKEYEWRDDSIVPVFSDTF